MSDRRWLALYLLNGAIAAVIFFAWVWAKVKNQL
jgi:hypothetical protein